MKIIVAPGKCQGHARCAAVAPGIFTLDNNGFIDFEERPVANGEHAPAQRGARACPERALSLIAPETDKV